MDSASRQAAITRALEGFPFIVAALLFGSQNTGTAGFYSDTDIAILPQAPITSEQRFQIIEALAQAAGTPIDLVDLAAEHGFVAREALLKGKLLFCRDRQRYQDRLRRLVYDAEDFLPALRQGQNEALKKWIRTSPKPS